MTHRLLRLAAATLLTAGLSSPSVRAADELHEPPREQFTPEITSEQVLARIAHLADDRLEGRESGTEGGRLTEEWVAGELARLGLEPLSATAGSAFTDVPMTGRAAPEKSWIEVIAADGTRQRFGAGDGAIPFSFSAGSDAEGSDAERGVAFAGFGITAADQSYDDYADLDVKGRAVVVLRHGPAEKDEASPWHNPMSRMQELAFSAKAKRAAKAGAAAILLVNDLNHTSDALPVEAGGEPSPIPVFAIRRATADLLLAPTGKTLAALQAEIDKERKPRSALVPGLKVETHAAVVSSSARNVVFAKRGTDPVLRDEAVLVCAHMDHVGVGRFGSAANAVGQIHNGADDNASGTAAVLEVAEAIASQPPAKRTILFALWCGEERGLVGSEHFATHPLWDLSKIAVCINMDMVGRYRDAAEGDSGLLVCGMPSALGTEEPVTRLASARKLRLTPSWEAWEQSDHFSFYDRGVPSLFLHTGIHGDYHRPDDDWWKILAEPEARIAGMVVDLTRELADSPKRPQFAKKPPRPVLGVRLDDAPEAGGARLVSVVPSLGAAAAGLQVGDVVTSFAGHPVRSARDLSRLIQDAKEGDVVDVEFRRGPDQKTVKVRVSGV